MASGFQYNNPKFKPRRKLLRNASTQAEIELWSLLKKSRLDRKKFRRQFGVGPYILDFYCPEMRLAIELDGSSHDSEARQEYDRKRTAYLEGLNITVLRFENRVVHEAPDWVLEQIRKHMPVAPSGLHDGDKVEVDADKGVVRIIKRA